MYYYPFLKLEINTAEYTLPQNNNFQLLNQVTFPPFQ